MSEGRRIAVAGITGFVGHRLPGIFASCGWRTTGISRKGNGCLPHVDCWQTPEDFSPANHFAVINLAGEPIQRRWNAARFAEFRKSRIEFTRRLVEKMERVDITLRPKVLVNASAVGFYGDRGEEMLDENAAAGKNELVELCEDWEMAAFRAEELGMRVVCLRFGIVLGREGGAYARLAKIFRLGLGGRLGDGRQWMPWVHVDDLRAAIVHVIDHPSVRGAVNAVAPEVVRNREFTRSLGVSVRRPACFSVPAWALQLGLGGFAKALLASQHVAPRVLLESGFRFRFPELTGALRNLAG